MIPIRIFLLLPAWCGSLLLFPALNAQSAYLEEDGLVVIEMENVANPNGWEIDNTISGATGTGYINWTGNQFFNQTGNGVLRYFVKIITSGTYRFEWRVAVGFGNDGTEHNDSWFKIGGDNFYAAKTNSLLKPRPACEGDPTYGCPNGSSRNGFFKTYGGGVNDFRWAARTSDNDAHDIFATFAAPGIYEIEVNARSSFHAIDRLVMYHSDVNSNTARELSNPESTLENLVTGVAEVAGELRTWHDIQLTFDGPVTSEDANPNPFADYRLDVTFTNGDTAYVVPGYYAADGNAAETSATGGNKWRVHFAPDATGTWSWSVAFKTGTDIAVAEDNSGGTSAGFMDGETGTFFVSPTNKTGRDHRGKGRLRYVGEHYLRYAETGEWFLKAGADAPENTLAYDDFDEVPNANGRRKSWQPHQQDYVAAEAEAYTWQNGKGSELLGVVNYLSGKGVNAFSFLTFNTQGDDKNVFPHLLINDLPNNTNAVGWSGLHHDRFDVSRTAQWEQIFSYADVKGMYLHFKTQETENNQLMDGGNLGRERILYYRELIARFGHHLALNWNMGEENTQTTQQRKDMAAYFADVDPYNHLRVLHTSPAQKNRVYTPLLGSASEYTGLSMQTADEQLSDNFGDTKTWVDNSFAAGKKWVVAVDEPGNPSVGIDSDPRDRKLTRHRLVWANFMAGGAGTEFYYGYQSGCGDLDCQDHRSRDEKYTDAALALNFFQTYFQPYLPNVVNADDLTTTNDDWVLNANNQAYVVYLPDGGSTGITLPTDVGVDWQVRWYNPRSGTISGATNITNAITAPDDNDWVALIEVGDCTEGATCDDGDGCTTNDLLDADCNCVGTFVDTDNDTVCDVEDQCPGENDLADVDNDGLPDACDDCDNTTIGTVCDDGNPDTVNDAIGTNCNCAGQPLPGLNDYWLEAECAAYGNAWEEVASASAVNGLYLRPVGTEDFLDGPPTDPLYYVSFDVTITTPGANRVFALVRTTGDGDDSFWVRANGGNDWVQWNKIGFDYGYNGFIWAELGQWDSGDDTTPVTLDLVEGPNVIDFALREPGIQFDRVFVTLDGDLPTGDGAVAFNCDDNGVTQSCGAAGQPPFQVLHFTQTAGFDHNTRNQSRQMFEEIGTLRNFTVVDSDDKSSFDDLTTLMEYEVIIFANTSGNIPFTAVQKANLESYVASGGGVLGIHAATDMYRDASYTFYTSLMGGSRRNSPAHTGNRFPGTMDKVGIHPSTTNVPDPWNKEEEYYYWPDTGLVDGIVPVLEVRSTGSNSYDAVRPASWYQEFPSGARSFYTTLGHFGSNYTDPDNDFRKHLADALCWLVEAGTTALPLHVTGVGLENDAGLHTIDWRVNGGVPARVELYGGYEQATAELLATSTPTDFGGIMQHRPNNERDWFYYRLRFISGDGLDSWSEWLAAAPYKEDAGGGAQVQYGTAGAVLVVPAGGPTQAFITDFAGRTLGGLQLVEGQNPLPQGPAGVYIIRFPFRAKALRYVVR